MNPIPILAGLVIEAGYMLAVPDSRWYEARLSQRFDAEIAARRQKLKDDTLPKLRSETKARFERLEMVRAQIDTEAQADKTWFREVLRKLDYLLEKFLVFALKEVEFHQYLEELQAEVTAASPPASRSTSRSGRSSDDFDLGSRPSRGGAVLGPTDVDAGDAWTRTTVTQVTASYEAEQKRVTAAMEAEQDPDTRAVLEKRVAVLTRRQEFATRIGKILTNLHHQLQLVEDTFGLINDEIRARSPEQILADIEEVVIATDSMASALDDLAPLDQMMARLGS